MKRALLLSSMVTVFAFASPSYATFWASNHGSRDHNWSRQTNDRDCDRDRDRDRDCDRDRDWDCGWDWDWDWNCDWDWDCDWDWGCQPEPQCDNPVPEPATAGLSMLGLGALATAVRRRRK